MRIDKNIKKGKKLLMLGPSPDGEGGISRVVAIWQEAGLLNTLEVDYISSVSGQGKKIYQTIIAFFRFLLKIKKINTVYVHSSSLNSFRRKSIFILFSLLCKKNVIIHIHPSHFKDYLLGATIVERKYIMLTLNSCNAIIVITNDMVEFFKGILSVPTFLLKNPIDVASVLPSPHLMRSESNFIYLGAYYRTKGVYDLVDAIEILVSEGIRLTLEFYGNGGEGELRDYVALKGLSPNISVNGWIKGFDKIEKLATSCALILPSYSEGFPNVVLEAMATKTPVIATPAGGLKEVLRDRENSFVVEIGKPRSIADGIKTCLFEKKLREHVATVAYSEVLQNNDIKVVSKDISNIIQQVI